MQRRAWPFLVLAMLIAAPVADAAKRPPKAELRGNGETARLGAWSYSWAFPSGPDACADVVADGIPSYDPVLSVAHRHARPRVVFLADRRPHRRSLHAYSDLDRHGFPRGDGKRVRTRLQPKERNGEVVAWAVRFRVDVVERPYFDLSVGFPKRGRCGEGGSAAYSFGIDRK